MISQELEGFYLEQALSANYISNDPILLINIGGGSTEIAVKKGGVVIDKIYLELGVKTIFERFPYINDAISKHLLEEVTNFINTKLPSTSIVAAVAVYSGGELTYMKIAGYNLCENKIFKDTDHPKMIGIDNFRLRNHEIFHTVQISELENYKPDDPLWMHGARACSAIAQAICEKFQVKTIIPSDSNTIHGVVKKGPRTVVLSGSFRKHLNYILNVKNKLIKTNVTILSPRFESPKDPGAEFIIFKGEENMSPLELERFHLKAIEACGALIVCDKGGYVGASSLVEIGYATALGKRIIFTEKPEEFLLRILPSEIRLDM